MNVMCVEVAMHALAVTVYETAMCAMIDAASVVAKMNVSGVMVL